MSTTCYSVLNDLMGAKFVDSFAKDTIVVSPHGSSFEFVYDHKPYDVSVTKIIGNTTELMDFGQALRCMKKGLCVSRKCWNREKFIWIQRDPLLVVSGKEEKAPGAVEWNAKAEDIMAEDWES